MKRHVICLGDSNTHGYCGAQEGETLCGGRFSEAERWPCLLQRALGEEYLVIEEGLCGRTTVFPDPLEPGLDAISYLRPCLLSHAPVSLLILMLGTNDTKERFGLSAEEIARGMERLARQAMSEDCWGPGGPDLLIVAPPAIRPEVEHSPVAGSERTAPTLAASWAWPAWVRCMWSTRFSSQPSPSRKRAPSLAASRR